MPGRLYVVSLPIGNLEDITLRAIRTLRTVDFIVAEDTRTTRRVLDRYRIKTPFVASYYQGVEAERAAGLVALLEEGKDLALVSDAGTPLVSDPGYPLVRAAAQAGISIIPIPGPSAAIAALVASGLPADHVAFDGAVPRKAGERSAYLESIRGEERTVILYESPHRLLATLGAIEAMFPKRRVVLCRELTKVHEEVLRGTAGEIRGILEARGAVRGECALVIEGQAAEAAEGEAVDRLVALFQAEGVPPRAAVKILIEGFGLRRNQAYRLVHRGKDDER
jgi:16S rRNA (cytidine1402-2'-O)-methyltransferase